MNKKNRVRLCAAVFVAAAAALSAGSLDYLSNQNAGYFFSTAQTASTAGAGIVPYNPAGTALLDKGFYLDVSNQTILKFYSESEDTYLKEDYDQTDPTPFLPSLALAYNFGNVGPGKLSVYGNGGICAGGGSLNWEDGTVGTNSYPSVVASELTATTVNSGSTTSLNASSIYYGLGTGVAYSFLGDKVSASAGLRYVIAERSGSMSGKINFITNIPAYGLSNQAWTADVDYDYTYSARGFTPIFGIDVRPVSGLTLGVRYEMETRLNFEYDTSKISVTSSVSNAALAKMAAGIATGLDQDGDKITEDLPQIVSFGAEYVFTPKFAMSAGTNLYFLGASTLEDTNGNDMSKYFGVGYELDLAAQYKITDKVLVGGTCMYSNQGAKSSYYEDEANLLLASANPALDSITVGGGVKYNVIRTLDLLFSTSYVHYLPVSVTTDTSGLELTYEKNVYNFCLGASYKF